MLVDRDLAGGRHQQREPVGRATSRPRSRRSSRSRPAGSRRSRSGRTLPSSARRTAAPRVDAAARRIAGQDADRPVGPGLRAGGACGGRVARRRIGKRSCAVDTCGICLPDQRMPGASRHRRAGRPDSPIVYLAAVFPARPPSDRGIRLNLSIHSFFSRCGSKFRTNCACLLWHPPRCG